LDGFEPGFVICFFGGEREKRIEKKKTGGYVLCVWCVFFLLEDEGEREQILSFFFPTPSRLVSSLSFLDGWMDGTTLRCAVVIRENAHFHR